MNTPSLERLLAGSALLLFPALAQAQIAFDAATNVGVGLRPDGVTSGDYSGDGLADLAVSSDTPDKVEILLGTGGCNVGASTAVFLPGGSSPAALVSRDFDGDGDVDIAVSLKNINQVRLLLNNGNGSFTLVPGSVGTGAEPHRMASADLDGDGDFDLVTSNRSGNSVSVLLNQGGVFTNVGTYGAGADPRAVALGDVTGDGLADIVVSSHDTRDIYVLRNLGGATFGAPTILSVGAQFRPEGVAVADVDGDGDLDILAALDNSVAVFPNLGGGTFGAIQHAFTGVLEPDSLAVGDFDGDGDVDVAVTHQDTNNMTVFTNVGGVFGSPLVLSTGARPGAVIAVDLGADGGVDLVTSNRDSNNLSIFCNQNRGGGSGPTTYCVSSPNSAGAGALMGSTGSLSIAANTFSVNVSGAIAGQPGLFFFGGVQTQVPFGNGFRCVTGATVVRLNPASPANGLGNNARAVDFTTAQGSTITAGSTWNFQYWYRDVAAGGAGFNLSNGLSATFQP